MPAPKSTVTIDLSVAEAEFFQELLTESAEKMQAAGEGGSQRMQAAMVRFLRGKARQIRDQLPEDGS